MATPLTKPQADMLLESVRADGMIAVGGRKFRVAYNLVNKGLFYESETGNLYSHTRIGLEELAYYWALKDAASGCMAYRLTREEVDRALADMTAEAA